MTFLRCTQGVRVSKKPRHTHTETTAIIPSDILGDAMEQVEVEASVVVPTFHNQRTRSKKMATAVTPTKDKAFNKKPSMTKESRIQQPR